MSGRPSTDTGRAQARTGPTGASAIAGTNRRPWATRRGIQASPDRAHGRGRSSRGCDRPAAVTRLNVGPARLGASRLAVGSDPAESTCPSDPWTGRRDLAQGLVHLGLLEDVPWRIGQTDVDDHAPDRPDRPPSAASDRAAGLTTVRRRRGRRRPRSSSHRRVARRPPGPRPGRARRPRAPTTQPGPTTIGERRECPGRRCRWDRIADPEPTRGHPRRQAGLERAWRLPRRRTRVRTSSQAAASSAAIRRGPAVPSETSSNPAGSAGQPEPELVRPAPARDRRRASRDGARRGRGRTGAGRRPSSDRMRRPRSPVASTRVTAAPASARNAAADVADDAAADHDDIRGGSTGRHRAVRTCSRPRWRAGCPDSSTMITLASAEPGVLEPRPDVGAHEQLGHRRTGPVDEGDLERAVVVDRRDHRGPEVLADEWDDGIVGAAPPPPPPPPPPSADDPPQRHEQRSTRRRQRSRVTPRDRSDVRPGTPR